MNIIEMKNVSIAYGENVIVENLNLEIPKGKITTIIGPNGCGKSTTLKTMGRLLPQKNGEVLINGENLKNFKTVEIAKKMAILPQTPKAPHALLVEELISYGRHPHKDKFKSLSKKDKEIIDWAIENTNLEKVRKTEIGSLSGGQRQRVWIAMALAQETEIVLLDEPTTYLDLTYQLEILELLEKLNREKNRTIVMVLHDLNLASRFADNIVAMKKGKVVKVGTPEEIMTEKVLKETFDIDALIVEDPRTKKRVCMSYNLIN